MIAFIIILALVVLILADALAYMAAKFPERTRSDAYKLPGGGFVALIRFGKQPPQPKG